LLPLSVLLMLAIGCGGCALSSQVDSYLGGGRTDGVTTHAVAVSGQELERLPAADEAYVRAAASEVLRQGEKDASMPWENPQSQARGTVTPIASAYTQDGQTCQNFLVSYVSGSAEAWMQGEACKQEGTWAVLSLKPWRHS
jgi:hypothetical protein